MNSAENYDMSELVEGLGIYEDMRLDSMPPEYRAHFLTRPHEFFIDPFRIEGNLYFIGNKEIGCYLIDSGDGLIVIDTGYEFTAGQFFNSIWLLGFDPRNIKHVFHTHNHNDHIAATNLIVTLSGATTYMGEIDGKAMAASMTSGPDRRFAAIGAPSLKFVPDVYTHDNEEFTIGKTTIRCLDTPGHSKGCQSFVFNVEGDDGKTYTAGIHGGLGILSLHKEFMQAENYPNARSDFFGHLKKIVDIPVDIYLGSHTLQGDMYGKFLKRQNDPNGPNPFIDPLEWKKMLNTGWVLAKKLIEDEENGRTPEWQKKMYADILKQSGN